ncbi:RidA family protein [candidate division KSB1 bacterium]
MIRTIIKTDKAPAPVGTFNQGIIAGSGKLLFTAGQIAIDPESNEVFRGDIEDQTRLCLNNIKQILIAGGTEMENLVKLTVFLKDLSNFGIVNEVFSEFFPDDPPARSAIEISELPLGVDIEIEGIAAVPQ